MEQYILHVGMEHTSEAQGTYSFPSVVQSKDKHIDLGLGKEISNQPGDERELGKAGKRSENQGGEKNGLATGTKRINRANSEQQLVHTTCERSKGTVLILTIGLPLALHRGCRRQMHHTQHTQKGGAPCDVSEQERGGFRAAPTRSRPFQHYLCHFSRPTQRTRWHEKIISMP